MKITPATKKVLDAVAANDGGRPLIVGGFVRDTILGHESKDVDIEVHGRPAPDPALVRRFYEEWRAEKATETPGWAPTDEEDAGGRAGALASAYSTELAHHIRSVGQADLVGRSFGVLKLRVDGEEFDVSLPRREVKVGEGHRGFQIGVDGDLDEVSAFGRRDFTINSMGWDAATDEIVDPYGGQADLEARMLRHTTMAFAEDPLRVLRGVRFAGRGFDMDPDTAELCRSLSGEYANLPKERIWTEWSKIAGKVSEPSRSLQVLRQTGWDAHYPEIAGTVGVRQDPKWHPEGSVEVHTELVADAARTICDRDGLEDDDRTVVVLGAMAHDFGKVTYTQIVRNEDGTESITSHGHAEAGEEPTRSFLERIGAPSHLADRIVPLVREHMCCMTGGDATPTPAAVRRLARRLGSNATIADWARVVEADHAGRGSGSGPSPADEWLRVAADYNVLAGPRKPLLTGEDLMARGLRPNPQFSHVVRASIEAQDSGEFEDAEGAGAWFDANRVDLLAKADALVAIDRIEHERIKSERIARQKAEQAAAKAVPKPAR